MTTVTTMATPHTVRPGETLQSIAAKYQQKPQAILQLNNMSTKRVHRGQQILVGKDSRSACSRTCVLVTGKKWQRCDCTFRNKKPTTALNSSYGTYGRDIAMINFASRDVNATVIPPPYTYEQKFSGVLPPYTHNTTTFIERHNNRGASPEITPSCIVERNESGWALLHYPAVSAESAAERSKFPIPTLQPLQPTVNLAKLYEALGLAGNSMEDQSSDGRPLTLSREAMALERAKFPAPLLTMASIERAKFPLPLFSRAEIERSKFPVPLLHSTA